MSTSTKRFIENTITLLILVLLLTLFTDASSQVFSVVGGFFGGKILADILTIHLQEEKREITKTKKNKNKKSTSDKELTSSLAGKVIKVLVNSGSNVKKGDVLLIVEACKMEMEVLSPVDGLIQEILVSEGDIVVKDKTLVRFY